MRLTALNTLVTGAASGIGEAIATRFAREGATVYVTDRDGDGATRVAEALRGEGFDARPLTLDVADAAACRAVAQRVIDEAGRLDVLVNNAGIGHVGTLEEATEDDLDRLYAVNVRGVFSLTRAFLPAMRARGRGNVVNVASIGGVVAIRERMAYCTTKFAVVGFTKCLALDHAHEGIRANAICPGRVETPFVQARIAEYPDPEAAYRAMTATQPVGRMATPDEIAAAALYLASEESTFVTGTAFLIDGGWTAGR